VQSAHKYARIERERRFLLEQLPALANVVGIRCITDLYIDNTALRLREQSEEAGAVVFKLCRRLALTCSKASWPACSWPKRDSIRPMPPIP
jgi:hypothetical protein